MQWFVKQIQKGNIKRKLPDLSEWDVFLIQLYAMTCRQDGIDIVGLEKILHSRDIYNNQMFYEINVILSRIYHYLR